MQPFSTLTAVAFPIDLVNLDTDRIIPSRFTRKSRSSGYQNWLFHDLRYRYKSEGIENPDFALNRPEYHGARIHVAAENFGCGSSREGAVWALADYGFRAWIAPTFGEIFFENSFKNGALAITLPGDKVARIRKLLHEKPGAELTIDLSTQTVRLPDGSTEFFEVDPFRKECLLVGMDEIELILRHEKAIAAYEQRQRSETPWLVGSSA